MRNASGHQGENERHLKKKKVNKGLCNNYLEEVGVLSFQVLFIDDADIPEAV